MLREDNHNKAKILLIPRILFLYSMEVDLINKE